jgi:hypothetical protein
MTEFLAGLPLYIACPYIRASWQDIMPYYAGEVADSVFASAIHSVT